MKKVIVITGGNSGLGKATAKLLTSKNKVVILGKNKKEVNQTAKELKCEGIVCDVIDAKQIKDAFKTIIKKHKKVDCLVNCAGVWITGPVEDNDPEKIKNTILVNTLGPILTSNAIIPQLKKQKGGRIVNVSSQAGLTSKANRSVYYASKWGVTGFTKSLELELAPFNISVLGLYPGFFKTDLFKKAGDPKKDFSTAMKVEKVAKALEYLINTDSDVIVKGLEIQSVKQL